jgi:hypothetical protein
MAQADRNISSRVSNKVHVHIVVLDGITSYLLTYLLQKTWPPLWSSSWLQIRRPGFDSRHYQKKKVVGLERGPFSLVSTTEELRDRKVEYGRRDPSRCPRGTPLSANVGNHFADKRRSLGRYSSLADSDHGVFLLQKTLIKSRKSTSHPTVL